MKKWDWLRVETAKTLENRWSRRCLSQFFLVRGIPVFHPDSAECLLDAPYPFIILARPENRSFSQTPERYVSNPASRA